MHVGEDVLMKTKPTYEELEWRVKELEQNAIERMWAEKAFKPNGEQKDLSKIELDNPHLVYGKYSIKDLIDIESLKNALEKFSLATGFTVGFLEYPSQDILIATGWRDICTKFHRAFPESAKKCKDGNVDLTKQLRKQKELNIKICKNGLVDGATPIVIKGKNIAYLATGQILFEAPDIERFKKQADMYGYDLESYLEALSEVPVVSEDQFKNALSFLSELAIMIAETGLKNLELKERTRELEEEITQRKLMANVLQESEEHFRKLAEGSFEAIIFHEKGLIHDANSQYYEMFGFNPEELAGKDAISLTATPESVETIKKQISLGNLRPYEVTGVKKDGTTFPIEIRSKLTSYKGYKVRMAVIRDLTEQKQSESDLRKSEQRYRLLVESTPDWVWICDEEGLHTFSNSAIKQILGYEVEEILGTSAFRLMHPEDRKNVKKWFQNAKKQKRGWRGTIVRWQHKDKSIRFLETIAEPILDTKGNLKGFTGIDRNITVRKQSEEALQKAHGELKERTIDLEIKRKSLEEINTAMRVLLKKRDADKKKTEEFVLANVKRLIEPYFKKIKKTKLNAQQGALLRIIESNLNEIISPFMREVSLKHFNLTSTEIQIAKQIRYGETTKKIAQFMNISPRTVETHRKNIRRKIGLEGKKANLRSYLLSIN